jgi:type I restriction enzyme S subunit
MVTCCSTEEISADLIGKTAVYKGYSTDIVFASYLIRVKPVDSVLPVYVSYYISSSFYGWRYITSVVLQQVGQANVNRKKLGQMPIPLPPTSEQVQIVTETERHLTNIVQVEGSIINNPVRIERMRQSVLDRVFSGKLL